ncbi:MAG: type II toxin-antitoxin system VapC family toxin [Spirochaetaceae bacterium]|nr:MAG: type II toxin-antitoxin system VapC family toxin [Spirochaetaceae bacterium]
MIKADLKRSGTIIADMDLVIAAIALVHKLPLVTNNPRHFARIKGLEVRSWL